MDEGVTKINAIRDKVGSVTLKDKSMVWNTARMEALEVDNLIEVARHHDLGRCPSRMPWCTHRVRLRAPCRSRRIPLGRNDKEWLKHTLWDSATNSLSYKPVNLKPLTVDSVPPKVRTF